jgi:Mg/Co/Ni transporter MgtE
MEAEKPNLKSLSLTFAAMKSPQVEAIFRETGDDMIVKILSLMKPDNVAKILSQMASETEADRGQPDETTGPARAARITEKLRLLKQEKSKTNDP